MYHPIQPFWQRLGRVYMYLYIFMWNDLILLVFPSIKVQVSANMCKLMPHDVWPKIDLWSDFVQNRFVNEKNRHWTKSRIVFSPMTRKGHFVRKDTLLNRITLLFRPNHKVTPITSIKWPFMYINEHFVLINIVHRPTLVQIMGYHGQLHTRLGVKRKAPLALKCLLYNNLFVSVTQYPMQLIKPSKF